MSTGTEVIGLQTQKLFRPDLHHRSGFTPSYGTYKENFLFFQQKIIAIFVKAAEVRSF